MILLDVVLRNDSNEERIALTRSTFLNWKVYFLVNSFQDISIAIPLRKKYYSRLWFMQIRIFKTPAETVDMACR